MILGFHFHTPAIIEDGVIKMPGYIGRFLDGLANEEVEKIICFLHSPTRIEKKYLDYSVQSSKILLINIGPRLKIYLRELFFLYFIKKIFAQKNKIDLFLLRGPSPLLPYFSLFLGNTKKVYMLIADQTKGLSELSQPYFRKKIIILWNYWNRFLQNLCVYRSDLIVNSKILHDDNINSVESIKIIRTTTLYEQDLHIRNDTCQSNTVKLLYTGRIDRGKGLFELVNSLSLLIKDKYKVELHIVGWASENDNIEDEIADHSKCLGVENFVIFHGYKPLGEELFSFYKKNDIYIMPSTGNEGFPRTIWEAMAHSMPVVATKVGSIPFFLNDNDNCLLIKPKSVKKLYNAIKKIINDKNLRKKIIKNGFKLASEQTIENRSKEMVHHLKAIKNKKDTKV